DFYMFSKGPDFLLDFPESRFSPRFDPFLYHCKQLFSESALASTWEALRRKTSGFVPEAQSSYGFYNPRIPEGVSQRDLFDRTLRIMGAGYSLQSVDPALVEQLRTVVRTCRDHNIGLKIAILPVHALDLELLYADGRWAEFEAWKTSLARILAEEGVEERFPLWDFTGYAGPAAEPVPPAGDTNTRMRYYFENSHFTPLLGGQILDALCGSPTNQLGAKLTCGTVKEHLARILEDRVAFARTQPAEVEWIQQILSEVSKKRKPLQVGAR
ncbi:MAG TPA: hypothetical protein VN673_15440, partial [Clostridia bacterium]|nr:hypothetical protein [Clostridia bacterium]